MDFREEEALYEFLDSVTEAFTIDEVCSFIQPQGQKRNKKLAQEIYAHLDTKHIAFKQDEHIWISRRTCFESGIFAITPTRLELLNGILIPGHRCIPFANPMTLPHQYKFFWKGNPVPATTTEAPPEDLYPYYCIFGDEFAPQYIARENPENEEAYNADPYDDPPEVSIHSIDMRGIYRECSFVPGDRFMIRTINWKDGHFEIQKAGKDDWPQSELRQWQEIAENGFEDSFALLGPGTSTEEQIAHAYWYGGKRMRQIPALSLEEFLYEKTDRIEAAPYGIESRFWFAGKEIPDHRNLQNNFLPPDRTFVEDIFYKKNIPISEFVILSYIRDAFFRNETDTGKIISRLVPELIRLEETERDIIADFISDSMQDFLKDYSLFLDQNTGPVRQRIAELHTAVIELSARLQKGEIESAWLPRHTFIILSQIQSHSAGLLEDLAFDEAPPDQEISAIDNSIDSMVDTYSDIKGLIENSMNNFRRSNLTVIRGGKNNGKLWLTVQISIHGLDIWRRAIIPHECSLEELHRLIQISMNWKGGSRHYFFTEDSNGDRQNLNEKIKICDIDFPGKRELIYEYGAKWSVNVMIMSSFQGADEEITRFVAGEGQSPPETVEGARHLTKILTALETGNNTDRQEAIRILGQEYTGSGFNLGKYNRLLRELPENLSQ
jgi:hypothetical protein